VGTYTFRSGEKLLILDTYANSDHLMGIPSLCNVSPRWKITSLETEFTADVPSVCVWIPPFSTDCIEVAKYLRNSVLNTWDEFRVKVLEIARWMFKRFLKETASYSSVYAADQGMFADLLLDLEDNLNVTRFENEYGEISMHIRQIRNVMGANVPLKQDTNFFEIKRSEIGILRRVLDLLKNNDIAYNDYTAILKSVHELNSDLKSFLHRSLHVMETLDVLQ
ncbi:hypothetical protein Ciccas_009914, partial [Cichlidogyrus casuarinus]